MPRKRKYRRHRRRVCTRNTKERFKTDLKDEMIDNEADLVTPVRASSSVQSSIKTTPVNRSKAYQKSKVDETRFNCTNLNYLFNSSEFEDSRPCSSGSEASNKNVRPCPPLSPNVQLTITVGSKLDENAICETPKISQIDQLDFEIQKTPQQSNLTSSYTSENVKNKDVNVEQERKSCRKELSCLSLKRLRSFNDIIINASPNHDKQNNISFGELSFFSPKLFYLQTASTPIETVKEETQAVQCKVSNLCKQHNFNRLDSYNSTPKNFQREIEMKDFCIINNLSSATKKSNVSTKFNFQAKIKRNALTKSISPFGSSSEKSDSFLHLSNGVNRFVGRVKRFHTRYTSKWTERLMELCSWLGLTIRKVSFEFYL